MTKDFFLFPLNIAKVMNWKTLVVSGGKIQNSKLLLSS